MGVATQHFIAHGYTGTSSREVAREAGVSHSLVNYHFGSKEGLFAEVMAINLRPSAVIDEAFSRRELGPLGRAQHIVATALRLWDRPEVHDSIVALLGDAMRDEAVRASIAEFFTGEIHGRIREHIGGRDAGQRAAGVSGIMAGIIFTRYVLRVEPMATLPAEEIVRLYAPSIAVHLR